MNINELNSFDLSAAVKFHDRLNPKIWGRDEHLLPEVQSQLLKIAADFQEFLGVSDLALQDITISGSNAAYSYTPDSDIDLHLVVDMPADNSEVYQELFNAKKYQYNDEHDIRIGGADVELYVQPADQPHVSQGIYSVQDQKWLQVPRRIKADLDDHCVQHKVEDLAARIDAAVESGDKAVMQRLWDKIKTMRQTGLAQSGEFGCDNLVFKMLRRSGHLERLKKAKTAAHDKELSLQERKRKKQRVRYGFGGWWYPGFGYAGDSGEGGGDGGGESVREGHYGSSLSSEDGVAPSTAMFVTEDDRESVIQQFIKHTAQRLGIETLPQIELHNNDEWSRSAHSFGRYEPEAHVLHVNLQGRHIMDILRTTAHELAHCRQQELKGIDANDGATGSPVENEAHAVAGIIMRDWADRHPELFADLELTENASGYIPKNRREAAMPQYAMALSVDIRPGQVGKEANKLGLKTGRNGEPQLLMKSANLREGRMPQPSQGPGAYRDLNEPLGPETPPTMPAGTVRVDVSDVYDWYKLGQHISNMKGLGRHDFGKGPPSSIISFGDEETEHKFIKDLAATGLDVTDIDPPDPKQPAGMQKIKTDPTYNVAEGSDFFAGSKFADEEGNTFSVEKIIAFAKKNPKYFHKDFPLSKIKHDLSWWQGNKERMMNADTSFPLLVIQNDDGHLGVADGLNRMKKAVDVEKKQTIDVYLVPKKDIMKFSEKQGVEEAFNNPYKTKSEKSEYGDVDMLAKLPDGTYLSIMFNKQQDDDGEEITQVEFYRNNSQEVTGEGDAQRIFATVLASIQKYIKKYKPLRLSFSASKVTDPTIYYEPDQPRPNPESRAKLYDRLVQRYARAWGYRAFRADTGDLVIYELSRINKQGVAEGLDAEDYKQKLLSSLPQMMQFFAKNVQGWKPSREQMLAAVETGYTVMKHTGDVQQAGRAVMDELNTLHRMSQGQKSVAEDELVESLRREFELLEDEFIGEIKMSPSNLRAEAAKTGAIAGMEFEMIVPGVKQEDPEPEPNIDDFDETCRSIDDAVEFFHDGDYNGRREVERLRERMQDDFSEWLDNKLYKDWKRNGEKYLEEWVPNNVDESEWNPDGLEGEARTEALEEFISNMHADPSSSNAIDEFREENQDSYDESDWLDAEDLDRMSAIEDAYEITWPHWDYGDGEGSVDIDTVANDFSEAVGMPVNASERYHGGRREAGHYVVEPDGSLDPDDSDDTGLEFVSPPMPIDEMLDQLKKVREWAGRYGCYTNQSTGLHINVSVPEFSNDKLDYVKLALLLGDQYVLDQFGRSSNTYTKSALGMVRDRVRDNPQNAQSLLDKMRGHMEDLATKAIHSGQTSKYTSINTKEGYIEFRSPGGDWLDDNFDKVENTLLRFTVALKAAMDPEAYREEYLKKLYKLLEPTAEGDKGADTVRYFADYVAGKIPAAALRSFVKQAQLQRKAAKGQAPAGQKYWWNVQWDANRRMEVVAANKDQAREVAAKEWGVTVSQLAIAKVTMLRPYEETEPEYEIFQVAGNRVVQTFRAADNDAALAYFDRTISAGDRPYYDVRRAGSMAATQPAAPSSQGGEFQFERPQTDIENRLGWPDQTADANYEVVNRNTLQPVYLFIANTDQDAARKYSQIINAMGMPGAAENYGYRARGSRMTPVDRQGDQSGSQRPAGGSNFTGVWLILDPDGDVIHSFAGVGNVQSDANRVAMQWLRANPGAMQDGVTVVPEMR